MAKRQAGALLIVSGAVLAVLAAAAAIIGGNAAMAPIVSGEAIGPDPVPTGAGYVLLVSCVGCLGLGLVLLSFSKPTFGGTPARRALKLLAFGLVGDAVILAMLSQPGFEGSNVDFLILPLVVFGCMTIIGAALTVAALVLAGGRPRRVGATFVVVPIALYALSASVNIFSGPDGVPLLLVVALSVLAGGALLLGFVGVALLALARDADTVVADAAIG